MYVTSAECLISANEIIIAAIETAQIDKLIMTPVLSL